MQTQKTTHEAQNLKTLEWVLLLVATKQNGRIMREALDHAPLLTLVNVQRVLGSLLDPTSFYTQYGTLDTFDEGLWNAYWYVRDNENLRKAQRHRLESLEKLRGVIGLMTFMIGLLKEAQRRHQVPSAVTGNHLQQLLDDAAVRNWFYNVYEPTMVPDDERSQNEPIEQDFTEKLKTNLELAQKHWAELDLSSLELYRIGTTSFILRCDVGVLRGDHLVLKCLLFPYTKIAPIANHTRKYAITYAPQDPPIPIATIRSSTDKWILMDFIEGPTLQEILNASRQSATPASPLLRVDLLAALSLPLLDALRVLPPTMQHEDLTPSNIIVSRKLDGSIKEIVFIDLGRNHLFTHKIGFAENRDAVFVAPEVKKERSSTTSDAYSFGMILIELADPLGVRGPVIPDSLYQYAPGLARFIEDLVDVNPQQRLLIFAPNVEKENIYTKLRIALVDELNVLPSSQEAQSGIQLWIHQIKDLFYPSDQLNRYRALSKLAQQHAATAKYAGRLYRWLVFSTIHWNFLFAICFLWGLRDFGIDAFPLFVTMARYLTPDCGTCVPLIDRLQAQGQYIPDVFANLPARLTIFSVMAQTKYYQNILAGLTTKPMHGQLARWTEITLRCSALCSLIPILVCNLYQPRWWLFMLVAGYTIVCINNMLCYQLAARTLESAAGKLSTALPADDHVLKAFGQWGPNMAIYMILLLAIAIGLYVGVLHDVSIYVIGTAGVSIFLWCISRCINLAPSVRGRLSRAFIAGERLEAIRVGHHAIQK